jgi:hypothetical protein
MTAADESPGNAGRVEMMRMMAEEQARARRSG